VDEVDDEDKVEVTIIRKSSSGNDDITDRKNCI
jgi:hypothetical protein